MIFSYTICIRKYSLDEKAQIEKHTDFELRHLYQEMYSGLDAHI